MKEFIYYFFTAFEGAFILIFLAKELMNGIIRRDANYYEAEEIETEKEMLRKANVKKRVESESLEMEVLNELE